MKKILLVAFILASASLQAQDSLNNRENAVKVFIDCANTFCDQDYIRQELPWVNYVRDRKIAQLHLLISSQSTASNGDEYLIDFIGLKEFDSLKFQLNFVSNITQTDNEIREGVVGVIKMGLMPFIAKTSLSEGFEINYTLSDEMEEQLVEDKWKSWVVDMSADAWFNGQESAQSLNLWNNLSIKKVTDDWKYVFAFWNSFNENKFQVGDEEIIGIRKSNSFDAKVVRSLGKSLSVGAFGFMNSSTFNNIDLSSTFYTGIEYNIFPYSESSKKLLRVNYGIGTRYNDYTETTIFNQEQELLYHQRLTLIFRLIQDWGTINSSVRMSNYLHDFDLNNISLNSNVRVRIVKGLSFNINGGVSFIHDQISLPKGEISLEETLLQQRQLATQFSYYGSVGVSYTFGSIYNNVVNPRFGFD